MPRFVILSTITLNCIGLDVGKVGAVLKTWRLAKTPEA